MQITAFLVSLNLLLVFVVRLVRHLQPVIGVDCKTFQDIMGWRFQSRCLVKQGSSCINGT